MGVHRAVQEAVAAALLANAGVTAIVGAAVYAPGQPFADSFPRTTLEPPQVLPNEDSCTAGSEVFVTVHHWAQGPDATLVAGDLADASRAALCPAPGQTPALVVAGFNLTSLAFHGDHAAGDPDPLTEHIVQVFRLLLTPAP